ncbi:hypothetical protein ES708_22252 [subsurface metagenome]
MPLTGAGGLPFVGCRLWRNANEATANNTWEYLDWTTEVFDAGGMVDLVANPSRITIPVTGLYELGFYLEWEINPVGKRAGQVNLNGVTTVVRHVLDAQTTVETPNLHCTLEEFVAGDFIELRVIQDSGGALNVLTGNFYKPVFWCYRVA